MNAIQEGLGFFWPQIVQAVLAGMFLSSIGLFVLLRRIVFGGLVIAQSSGMVLAFLLALGVSSLWLLPLTALVTIPLLYASLSSSGNREAWLATLLVVCTAASEITVSLGARAEMHAVQALSGNVLTMLRIPLPVVAMCGLIWLVAFRLSFRFMSRVFFDRDQSRLHGDRPAWADWIFFAFLFCAVTFGTMQMGAYYTMAHLIVPAATVVPVSQSIPRALVMTSVLSSCATFGGFLLSFLPFGESSAHLPTSSAVIACLGAVFLLTRLLVRESR